MNQPEMIPMWQQRPRVGLAGLGRLVSRVYIREFGRIPTGWGLAYWCIEWDVAVCYPIPLNLVIRALRLAWIWALQGGTGGLTRTELARDNRLLRAQLDAATDLLVRTNVLKEKPPV